MIDIEIPGLYCSCPNVVSSKISATYYWNKGG